MKYHLVDLQFCAALLAFSAYESLSYENKVKSKVSTVRRIALKVLDKTLQS